MKRKDALAFCFGGVFVLFACNGSVTAMDKAIQEKGLAVSSGILLETIRFCRLGGIENLQEGTPAFLNYLSSHGLTIEPVGVDEKTSGLVNSDLYEIGGWGLNIEYLPRDLEQLDGYSIFVEVKAQRLGDVTSINCNVSDLESSPEFAEQKWLTALEPVISQAKNRERAVNNQHNWAAHAFDLSDGSTIEHSVLRRYEVKVEFDMQVLLGRS